MTKLREQVLAFHRERTRIGKSSFIGDITKSPPEEITRLRLGLVAEEFLELLEATGVDTSAYKEALQTSLQGPVNTADLVEVADALADIDYVVEGFRVSLGVDGEPIADEVHCTNMAKFGPGSRVREDGKILKPPDWTPPDIAGLLRKQGWPG